MKRRSLNDLSDTQLLRVPWKKLLRSARTVRLQEFSMAHDPLEWLAYDYFLKENLSYLSVSLENYSYLPSTPHTIRGAKSVGLTRPITYLSTSDALVYASLVKLTENELIRNSLPWSRFGRAQRAPDKKKKKDPEPEVREYSWFVQWMKRQGQVWNIVQTCDWIVETDISNFFATLGLDDLVSYVRTYGQLDETLNNLLRVKLGEYVPLNDYRPNRNRSLPQETMDVSRVLAHGYLRQLDERFEPEGNAGRYSRWVDDVVIGADSWEEALTLVRRFQVALERLNLHPNSAKTRIIPSTQFALDYDRRENDYIGDIEEQIDLLGRPLQPSRFRRRVQAHARLSRNRKPSWDRVLRRYYTVCKRLHDDSLVPWWHRHVQEAPRSAGHILEYIATFHLTTSRVAEYRVLISRLGGVYTDVEILAREALLVSPNLFRAAVWDEISDWGLETVRDRKLAAPFTAASGALLVAKFGTENHIDQLLDEFRTIEHIDNSCRTQLASILFARERLVADDLISMLHVADRDAGQQIRYLLDVNGGTKSAYSMLRGLAQPVARTDPQRSLIRPRILVLLPLLRRVDPKWSTASKTWIATLRRGGRAHHDAAALRFLMSEESRV